MPRPRPNLPRYVVLAEITMRECFELDLWRLRKPEQDAIILAALDACDEGDAHAPELVEVAVFDRWREIVSDREGVPLD